MKETFPKWLIESGEIKAGMVTKHIELVKERSLCSGGGWYHVDEANNVIHLYNTSSKFNCARVQDIEAAVQQNKIPKEWRGFDFTFSTEMMMCIHLARHTKIKNQHTESDEVGSVY